MSLDFSVLPSGLLSKSPFTEVSSNVIVPDKAVVFKFALSRFPDSPVQANLDAWPGADFKSHPLIRVGTQGKGCFFGCESCDAGAKPGKNLWVEEITYQVIHILASGIINFPLQGITIATMGTGEPFVNKQVISAVSDLRHWFPQTHFMLSTTGPCSGKPVFDEAVSQIEAGADLDLQLSINILDEKTRLRYIGDNTGRMSWTLTELSQLAREWFDRTERPVHASFVVGPGFPVWEEPDYDELAKLFPPSHCIIKLSLESLYGGKIWDPQVYLGELEAREIGLRARGYQFYRFILPGITVPGGGCGSLEPVSKLIHLG